MVHVKVSKLMLAALAAAAGLITVGGVAQAAPADTTAAVACVNGATTTCDPTVCADGVLSVVTDDNGVQHQACVASAAETPVAPTPPASSALLRRATTTPTTQAELPATGSGTDGLVIAALLVGCGSVVSLLSRRRPAADRKGFRRRGVTS
jgi:LPXTG-motif cell wall-anchored protein